MGPLTTVTKHAGGLGAGRKGEGRVRAALCTGIPTRAHWEQGSHYNPDPDLLTLRARQSARLWLLPTAEDTASCCHREEAVSPPWNLGSHSRLLLTHRKRQKHGVGLPSLGPTRSCSHSRGRGRMQEGEAERAEVEGTGQREPPPHLPLSTQVGLTNYRAETSSIFSNVRATAR